MLAEMPGAMFVEWMAYAELEPFGETRADLRSGIIASVMANAHRAKEAKPFKPQDFMPRFGQRGADEPETDEQDWRSQMELFRALTAGREETDGDAG